MLNVYEVITCMQNDFILQQGDILRWEEKGVAETQRKSKVHVDQQRRLKRLCLGHQDQILTDEEFLHKVAKNVALN